MELEQQSHDNIVVVVDEMISTIKTCCDFNDF